VVKTTRYSFKDERYFYYLIKNRFHEDEQKAWMEIGRVIKERGSIEKVDAGLIFFENVKGEDETLKRNFNKRIKQLVDDGALDEESVYTEFPKEKLRRYRLE